MSRKASGPSSGRTAKNLVEERQILKEISKSVQESRRHVKGSGFMLKT